MRSNPNETLPGTPANTRKVISAFQNHGSIFWVCPTSLEALARWESLGCPENVRMGTPGCAVAGMGFDEIILESLLKDVAANSVTWMNRVAWAQQIRCRLNIGGKLRNMY